MRFTASLSDEKGKELNKLLTPKGSREVKRGRLSKLFNVFIDAVLVHPQLVKACKSFAAEKELKKYEDICITLNDLDTETETTNIERKKV